MGNSFRLLALLNLKMKDKHHRIAQTHVELKRIFIEFCQLARPYVDSRNDATFVLGEDDFSSIAFYVHGRKVVFHFSIVFQADGPALGQIRMIVEEVERPKTELGAIHYDALGNLKGEQFDLYNLSQEEGVEQVLLLAADFVVSLATVKV